MEKKPTDELNQLLENMRPEQLDAYYKDNEKYLADGKKGFYYYMKDVLYEKNIKLKDVQLKLLDEDFRPAIVDEDVEGLTTDRIQLYP